MPFNLIPVFISDRFVFQKTTVMSNTTMKIFAGNRFYILVALVLLAELALLAALL